MIKFNGCAAAEPWTLEEWVMRLMNHMMVNASRPKSFTRYAVISLNRIMHNGHAVRLGGMDTWPS
jgi:hypothetical protein